MSRYWAREEIARLDPETDYERMTHLVAEVRWGDPVLSAALYTVAFCRQMAVPSIAAVVHRGGNSPIMRTTRKRNDDTMVFFGEFMRLGPSSEQGRAWIERLNAIHARFPIRNDQSLYTLASLTLEVERIPALFGQDPLDAREKLANFHFWQAVGRQMGLTDMPPTPAAFRDWALAYERAEWAPTAGGRAVALAMVEDYAARWTGPRTRRLARELTYTLMEDELLAVHRLKRPRPATRRAVGIAAGAYFSARNALPDPADRSWSDHYRQAGGPPPPPGRPTSGRARSLSA